VRLRHRRLHLRAWLVLAVILPAVLLAGLALRLEGTRAAAEGGAPPVRLVAP